MKLREDIKSSLAWSHDEQCEDREALYPKKLGSYWNILCKDVKWLNSFFVIVIVVIVLDCSSWSSESGRGKSIMYAH